MTVVDSTVAACREHPTEWWFMVDPTDALEVCRGCPVSKACCEAADRHEEEWGVWGGVNRSAQRRVQDAQRRVMHTIWGDPEPERKGRTPAQEEALRILMEAVSPSKVSPLKKEHGSRRSYRAGCRCDACCDAHVAEGIRQKERRAAKRARRQGDTIEG